jgi:hypothetical protein
MSAGMLLCAYFESIALRRYPFSKLRFRTTEKGFPLVIPEPQIPSSFLSARTKIKQEGNVTLIIAEKILIVRNDRENIDKSRSTLSSELYGISSISSPIPIDEEFLNHHQCKRSLLFGLCPGGGDYLSRATRRNLS